MNFTKNGLPNFENRKCIAAVLELLENNMTQLLNQLRLQEPTEERPNDLYLNAEQTQILLGMHNSLSALRDGAGDGQSWNSESMLVLIPAIGIELNMYHAMRNILKENCGIVQKPSVQDVANSILNDLNSDESTEERAE